MNDLLFHLGRALPLAIIFGLLGLLAAGVKRWRHGYLGERPIDPKIRRRFNAALERFENSNPAFRHIKAKVLRQMSKDMRAIEKKIAAADVAPYYVINQYVGDIAGDELQSGLHHLHRGVLTPIGEELLALYAMCWNVAGGAGLCSTEIVLSEITSMGKIIASLG